ncbi:MAG: nucleotidyltransferase family protein [Oscillospiraceae bacterium]|nr:nucleotidyltransferase family protein [Oscillospiraceae bacterium]
MKTYGIICEYNPFHNGHIYQIEETKKQTGATHIVAIMSGNFVQRGEPALMDKFKRAEIAVKNGVDLVVEMPVQYSLANAELFARCGVMMLGSLRCVEGISFGSECGSVEQLVQCADAVRDVSTPENLKPLMEQGIPFPDAVHQLVSYKHGPLVGDILNSPNNILAVEYIKSLQVLGLMDKIKPFTIKREGAEHDSDEHSSSIASGSYIRRLIDDGEDFSAFVPKDTADAIAEYDDKELLCWFENFERVLLYRLRTMSPQELASTPDVGQGLENRIFQAARVATSLEDLLDKIKVKRYPMARIKRILLNALFGIKTDDIKVPPIFGRILALNDRGAEILKMAGSLPEDKLSMPFSSSLKDFIDIGKDNKNVMRSVAMTTLSSDIYNLGSRNIRPSGMDFTGKVAFDKIEGFVSELPEDMKTTAISGTPEEIAKIRAEKAAAKAEAEAKASEGMASEESSDPEEKNDD